jgi:hypothetical protein
MSEPEETSAVSNRTLEIVVALVLLALAFLIMWAVDAWARAGGQAVPRVATSRSTSG